MATWEDMNGHEDSYLEFLKKQAKEAMNDKEVGLIGQAEATKEYENLKKKLSDN